MRNKKLLVVLLGLVLMLAVVACGNKETDKKAEETVQSEIEDDKEDAEVGEEADKKTENAEGNTQSETPENTESDNTQPAEPIVTKTTMYAKSNVNVRSGAGASNSKLGSLTKGQEIVKVGEENGWSKIEFNGGIGYVKSGYLSTEKVSTSVANNGTGNSNNNSNNTMTPSTSTPVEKPVETKPEVKECEHWYQPVFEEYDIIEHYVYGCNGCGYPLFTLEGNDAINIPDLYFHPACETDRYDEPCTGGGFHSEWFISGQCAVCRGKVVMRQCMFSVMGLRCIENEALGPYEKTEGGENPIAYIEACDCGENLILKSGANGKGQLFVTETCSYCGDVQTYPKQ